MDKKQLNTIAKKATDLWQSHDYEDADKYYDLAYPHIDHSHWNATNFLNCYGLNLESLGRNDDAERILTEALDSAKRTDAEDSGTVTYARFSLGEHLYRKGKYDSSIEVISPSISIECESKWLVMSLAARNYYRLSNIQMFEQAASALLFLAPKGKFNSVSQIRGFTPFPRPVELRVNPSV